MIDVVSPLIKKFLPFAQECMGFEELPKLFLKGSDTNAEDPLGKTAYYNPQNKSITVFITGRHPKDVMRSISHELVHHAQNCRGEFDNVGEMEEGYAQNDNHLREMEREAYEIGNLCFRDWSDSIKNTTYFEQLNKGDSNLMSIKTWKNKEIKTLLTENWGLKMDLEALSEESTVESEEIVETEELDTTDTETADVVEETSTLGKKPGITVEQIREIARRAITRLKETKKNG